MLRKHSTAQRRTTHRSQPAKAAKQVRADQSVLANNMNNYSQSRADFLADDVMLPVHNFVLQSAENTNSSVNDSNKPPVVRLN